MSANGNPLAASFPSFLPGRPVNFTINVDTGSPTNPTDVTFQREMPFDGWLAVMFVRWESGAGSEVGVQLRLDKPERGNKVVPVNSEDDYAAFNDTNRRYHLWIPAKEGRRFFIKVRNEDNSSGHTIAGGFQMIQAQDWILQNIPAEMTPKIGEVK